MMRTAALNLPASSLLVTAAASLVASLVFLVYLQLTLCNALSAAVALWSHAATLLLMILLKFLLTPPLLGFARMLPPN